MFLDKPEVVV